MSIDLSKHWNAAYETKGERGVSWFQQSPELSVELIANLGLDRPSVLDVGGGASQLVDVGLERGWDMAVLDVAESALEVARAKGLEASEVASSGLRPISGLGVRHGNLMFGTTGQRSTF